MTYHNLGGDHDPLLHYPEGTELSNLPPIRLVRNAILQQGIGEKVRALFSYSNPLCATLGDDTLRERSIVQVITSVQTRAQLMKLIESHDVLIIHAVALPDRGIVGELQKQGYKLSFVAPAWNYSGSYIIEKVK